ncbi:MAG: HAD family hydrolase [Defluviimonas sp.]|uniref:HAD family hydrolase n=1 Tax=Albidovulum sp. TaxID=1872424 RepID=UPI001D4AEE79|nr:HAD family hydrolase [Paracoccaceae bacterium]MCC0063712.1 HAD family hydrolase [Defluviimonas sp.]
MGALRGLVFDKDGTLFDFRATWGGWTRRVVEELSGGDATRAGQLSDALGFDPKRGDFAPGSPVIAHTATEIAGHLLPLLPGIDRAALVARMNALAADVTLVEAVPLGPLFARLAAMGLRLGLVTNDAEAPARAHLARSGLVERFHFVAGFDSGHGAKPDPGPLLAFARQEGLRPGEIAMVGDSRHDLVAGEAAGMLRVGVLTGIAGWRDLAPHADVVLDTIAGLPEWIAGLG